MRRYVGEEAFPIWLLGDSNPENWQTLLDTPLDPRHPARHNIWTSVLDEIQDVVFRSRGYRVDSRQFYIRNAIEAASTKPKDSQLQWSESLLNEVEAFQASLRSQSCLIFAFGSFAFEFARRAMGEPPHAYRFWTTIRLGNEFRDRLASFTLNQVTLIPLLHVSIARRYFLSSHRDFCGLEGANYFEYVGQNIGNLFLEYHEDLPIWIGWE